MKKKKKETVDKTVVMAGLICINEAFTFENLLNKMSFFMNSTECCKPEAIKRNHAREREKKKKRQTSLPVAKNFYISTKLLWTSLHSKYNGDVSIFNSSCTELGE